MFGACGDVKILILEPSRLKGLYAIEVGNALFEGPNYPIEGLA